MISIEGAFCPACGEESLSVSSQYRIQCDAEECPRRSAAHEILADHEREHLVTFRAGGSYSLRHPLIERLNDEMVCRAVWVLGQRLEGGFTPGDNLNYRMVTLRPCTDTDDGEYRMDVVA
ncbi:DUF6085 family protein [Longimicrobium sp.]|uniref:DUF6085 family protein n=1 Tax=Longimicrobium sp. TaxID=2029185 RepID=UPI002EDA0559